MSVTARISNSIDSARRGRCDPHSALAVVPETSSTFGSSSFINGRLTEESTLTKTLAAAPLYAWEGANDVRRMATSRLVTVIADPTP